MHTGLCWTLIAGGGAGRVSPEGEVGAASGGTRPHNMYRCKKLKRDP